MPDISGCLPSPMRVCDAVGLTSRSSSKSKKGLIITSIALIAIGGIATVISNYVPVAKIGLLGAGIPLIVIGVSLMSVRIGFNSAAVQREAVRDQSNRAARRLEEAITSTIEQTHVTREFIERFLKIVLEAYIRSTDNREQLNDALAAEQGQQPDFQTWINSRAPMIGLTPAVFSELLRAVVIEARRGWRNQVPQDGNAQEREAALASLLQQAHDQARGKEVLSREMKIHLDNMLGSQNWSIGGELAFDEADKYSCAISTDLLKDLEQPCFLAEEGHTYELESIKQQMLINPGHCPQRQGELIQTPTLVKYASRNFVTCPLSKQPFREAYFCIEDGYTYERQALVEHIKKYKAANPEANTIPSPADPSRQLNSITIWGNRALAKVDLPPQKADKLF